MNFVDDHRLDRAQQLAALAGGEHQIERLGRGDQNVRRMAEHRLPLGGVTRNAVIGKVHRLGLSGRATPSQPQRPIQGAARAAPGDRRGPRAARRSSRPRRPRSRPRPISPRSPAPPRC